MWYLCAFNMYSVNFKKKLLAVQLCSMNVSQGLKRP